ncbi:MAG: BamA/TamA family outer membrane protein [Tenuifilaceae bacterium]|jgi:outer membrane protein assembly factor BamA|nr:BamA/TamA family outer membrane protein [Tenuifilaceae bacterium]
MAKLLLSLYTIIIPLQLLSSSYNASQLDSIPQHAPGAGRNSTILVPVAFYQEETSVGFGLMGGVYFTKNRLYRSSNLQGFVIYTLKNQVKLALLPKFYSQNQRYYFSGHLRATHYPDKYFGVGPSTSSQQEESFTSREVSILAEGQYLINHHLMLGPALSYSTGFAYNLVPEGELAMARPPGTDPYHMPAVGVVTSWDTRDNILYASQGELVKLSVLTSQRLFGSTLPNIRAKADVRKFIEIAPNHIIATRLFADMVWGDSPFQDLPSLGGNEVLRGYYHGRYRDTKMISLTSEYRFPIVWRITGGAFASAADVQPSLSAFNLKSIKYSFGGGLRFRVNQAKMHIRFDLGVTLDRRPAVYITANESF